MCICSDRLSKPLSQCLEEVLPHGSSPVRQFLLFYLNFGVASTIMRDDSLVNERVEFPLTSLGSKLYPGGPVWRHGREFPFSQRICNPLIMLQTSNISFTGQSSYLISDECSG